MVIRLCVLHEFHGSIPIKVYVPVIVSDVTPESKTLSESPETVMFCGNCQVKRADLLVLVPCISALTWSHVMILFGTTATIGGPKVYWSIETCTFVSQELLFDLTMNVYVPGTVKPA